MRFLSIFFTIIFSITCNAASPVLETFDGESIPFASLKGKWIYINYWASWCPPCLHEIAAFNQFYTTHKNQNIAVFGVNYDGVSQDEQPPLIKKYKLAYPSLRNDPTQLLNLGEIKGIPVTFIFNPDGKLYDIKYGEQTQKSLQAYLSS